MKLACTLGLLVALAAGSWGCDLFQPEEPEEKKKKDTVEYTMPEHGIVDFLGVEGIAVDIHTSDALTTTFGSPEVTNESGDYLYYYYPSRGLKFNVNTVTDVVVAAYVYGEGWRYNVSGTPGTYDRYPYATSRGVELNMPTSTMDHVLENYGEPTGKGTMGDKDTTEPYPRYFRYVKDTLNHTAGMDFYFVGTDTTDYAGKEISKITMY